MVYSRSSTLFQSTLLMRGATYPRFWHSSLIPISIHAPHARSDYRALGIEPRNLDFNPRSSCEERQYHHAKRNGHIYFNPRSSCEERLPCARLLRRLRVFQSTLLMRGATYNRVHKSTSFNDFNPRSSCEERLDFLRMRLRWVDFNPRSSCEERRTC